MYFLIFSNNQLVIFVILPWQFFIILFFSYYSIINNFSRQIAACLSYELRDSVESNEWQFLVQGEWIGKVTIGYTIKGNKGKYLLNIKYYCYIGYKIILLLMLGGKYINCCKELQNENRIVSIKSSHTAAHKIGTSTRSVFGEIQIVHF